MAVFPALKTGAVAQYPAERQIRCSTQVVEFLDGTEQRFRDYTRPLRRWTVRLDQLDASEVQAILSFFDEAGVASPFSFTDPWDGTVHANCVAEGLELAARLLDEFRGQTELTIRENLA
jgi:phage-related protein